MEIGGRPIALRFRSALHFLSEWTGPGVGENCAVHGEASGERFVGTAEATDGEQGDYPNVIGNAERGAYFVFVETFHGGGVIAEDFGHPHHGGEGEHGLAVDPDRKIGRCATRHTRCRLKKIGYRGADALESFFVVETIVAGELENFVEVAVAPGFGISAGDDDDGGFFHFGLGHGGLAEALALRRVANDNEAPGLQVVTAGGC